MNPLSPDDIQLLTLVANPKFVISDLRNEDPRRELYGEDPTDAKEKRRRSANVVRTPTKDARRCGSGCREWATGLLEMH